ncbi:hypothetical protein JMN11_12450 [Capnocytophaga genosp. AHN8471]|jgi:hypothetical protein|uniref:hypothetical protein n=1 Tax=Capnocytophaga genosp. AHN8471 TaxID=327574 RepID=UPI0019340B2D|nr:hypothetical protein [Capnocytophaga genosp. AHN8471]MBM0654467.1 hypothetical protein [Capnocytophaga genosp. AHN8471]
MELHKKSEIYSFISDLSLQLLRKENTYSRADVAFELKNLGVEEDSFQVELLIKETYENTDPQTKKAIAKVFFDNRMSRPIIDENSVKALVERNQWTEAVSVLKQESNEVNRLLEAFMSTSAEVLNTTKKYVEKYQLAGYVTGSVQVSNVKKEAEMLYIDYQKFIDNYAQTKNQIIELIEDFTFLRSNILNLYREKVSFLTDVFGEKIKAIEPKLFDFNVIEWLDTASMLKNIELEYENLINTCTIIVSELHNKFSSNFSNSLRLLGKGSGGNSLSLAMVGLNIFNSWAEASQQATILKQEVEKMKQKMIYDVNLIKADLNRLQLIDTSLRNVYIPTAYAFQENFEIVFSKELKNLLNTLYENPQIKELKDEKDRLLAKFHSLESDIIDHQTHITLYEGNIQSEEKELKAYNPLYLKAKSQKPKKPIFFGRKSYNRDVAEWHQEYYPIIEAFVEAREQLKIDKEELSNHKRIAEEKKKAIVAINKAIDKQSEQINQLISKDVSLQSKIAKYLAPMINLLRLAKKITELKIDEKYLKTVKLEIPQDIKLLPIEISNGLKSFLSKLKIDFQTEIDKQSFQKEQTVATPQTIYITNETSQLFSTAINIVEETLKLKELQLEGKIQQEYYTKQLTLLQNEFQNSFSKLNDRSKLITEISKNIQCGNQKDLKDVLLLLIDEQDKISESEIVKALKENKHITI